MGIPKRKKVRKGEVHNYSVSKHYSKAYHYYNIYIQHVGKPWICACMCMCHIQYSILNIGVHLQDWEHAFKCIYSGEKVRLSKWEIFTHVWAKVYTQYIRFMWPFAYCKWGQETENSSITLAAFCQNSLGHTGGVPRSYSHLIIVIRQSCSGPSVLPANQQLVTCMCVGKTGNSVCLGMCGERVKLVPVHGLAGNTVYCSCSLKKGI